MNCQDLALILDDQGFDALDGGARAMAMAHLESCADCRRDRELHARLVARSVPPMPADLVADCRALVASSPQAGRSQRARSRFMLIGTVAVVAAAAAMLMVYLWPAGGRLQQAPLAETTMEPVIEEAGSASVTMTDPQSGSESGKAPDPAFLVFVAPLREPGEIVAASKNDPMSWLGEQVAEIERNPVRRNAFIAFRSALISELLTIPGIGLADSESQLGTANPSVPGFGLRITGSYGRSADGKLFDVGTRYINMVVSVVRPKPDGTMTQQSFGSSFQSQLDLEGGACRTNPAGTTCGEAHSLAADVVRRLRASVFPPDADMTRERQARLMNASLEPDQRFKALEELLGPQGQHGRAALRDPATVRGLLALAAAGDPALRARIWRAIRGVAEPDILPPLQAAAMNDADDARLEAVVTLAADFVDDPRARVTLEAVASSDRRALVRALAERGLYGDATWKAHVNASLRDANRLAAERVEAIVYEYEFVNRQPVQDALQLPPYFDLLDEGSIDVLAQLLPEASKEQPAREGSLVRVASNMATRFRDNDAVTDALLHFLRHGKSSNTRRIALADLARTRRDDEQVRTALRETLRSDPDPAVRERVTELMGAEFAAAEP